MPVFRRDGIDFHYRDQGEGAPFVFQHGLGGDVAQPFGLVQPPPGFRMLAFDCRGHGKTSPLGDEDEIGLAPFAADLAALLDHLGLDRAIIGGISMGAAVALNFALRYPDRTLGLILSRPAWLDRPFPENTRVFPRIAALIREHGATGGLALFKQSDDYAEMKRLSPDAAQSLVGHFEGARAEDAVARLERIPHDAPSLDREAWRSIAVPTLVLANKQDPIHPFAFGETIAGIIPGAEFRELTPKSVSFGRHADDVLAAVTEFLQRHFAPGAT
jgi:pimeloyl-ACP methyl ester carboxylesterase